MTNEAKHKRRFTAIILAYPLGLMLISIASNVLIFGIDPAVIALPSSECVFALVIAATLLVINHTWLMTSTELTRLNYSMHATPEEQDASGNQKEDISKEGLRELERRHNAHRNATENTTHFVFLAFVLSLTSPTALAAQFWIIGYAVARLGYTFSYLSGRDGARGLCMSLSLIAMYGIASYLAVSLLV